MSSWSQWSSLLSPNPDPNAFNGRSSNKGSISRPPSAANSIRSFMSALSLDEFPPTSSTWGRRKGKLKKQRRMSPPPELQPLAFTAFDAISIPSPSSTSGSSATVRTRNPLTNQENPPNSRPLDCRYDGIYGYDDGYDGHITSETNRVPTSNRPFPPTNFVIPPSIHTQEPSDGGIARARITRTTLSGQQPVHVSVVKTFDVPAIVTTPSSPATPTLEVVELPHLLLEASSASTSNSVDAPRRLTKKRSAPSRLPSPSSRPPPVPPLPKTSAIVLSSTEAAAQFASQAATSSSFMSSPTSPAIVSPTPSSVHQSSVICRDTPKHTDSTGLPNISVVPDIPHAPQSNHSHSTRSSETSPSASTPATSLPPSSSLDHPGFAISEENAPQPVHEVQSECGHERANLLSTRRPSLLRNFSLSVGMSSSSISRRKSEHAKASSSSDNGSPAVLTRSRTFLRRRNRGRHGEQPPPPPSSWADVASPLPSSTETTSASGHGGSSPGFEGGAFTSSNTSGGSWVSANNSSSDLGFSFTKWRKWRKKGRVSMDGSSQSAFSSRTSLGVEDDVSCVPGLPPSMPPSSEKKGKEREVAMAEGVAKRVGRSYSTSIDFPSHQRPSLSERQEQDGHRLSRPKTPQERIRSDHKKSGSWSDAAAALFRSSPRHSNTSIITSSDVESPRSSTPLKMSRASSESSNQSRATVGVVGGRRVLKKDRLVDLGVEYPEPVHSNRNPRAKFTIGDDDDEPHSTSQSAYASVVALSPENLLESNDPSSATRPPLVRRDALMHEGAHIGRRRWTLADAMINEGISDAGLVRELERMREVAEWARRRERMQKGHLNGNGEQDEDWDGWDEWDVGREILEGRDVLEMERQKDKERDAAMKTLESGGRIEMPLTESPESEVPPLNPANDHSVIVPAHRPTRSPSASWLTAQRALLTCRELILTERHYLSQLSALVKQETSTSPPPLMLHHASELFIAADAVLKSMEREPSARGVAKAFLEREAELEGAYMRWCTVVGGWFSGDSSFDSAPSRPSLDLDRSVRKRSRGSNKTEVDTNNASHADHDDESGTALKRSVSTWRKSMPSIPSLGIEGGSVYGGHTRRRDKEEQNPSSTARKAAVRELAILPTQRVMRYVLLYRDLLSHTPTTSASRSFVERAVDAACRIADKCDRAQNNSAFFIAPSPPNSSSIGGRSSSKHRGTSVSRPVSPSAKRTIGSAATSATAHHLTTMPTVSPTLSPPPASAKSSSRPSSPIFGEPSIGNANPNPRRASTSAISLMSFGWNKSHRGIPSFAAPNVVAVATVAPT